MDKLLYRLLLKDEVVHSVLKDDETTLDYHGKNISSLDDYIFSSYKEFVEGKDSIFFIDDKDTILMFKVEDNMTILSSYKLSESLFEPLSLFVKDKVEMIKNRDDLISYIVESKDTSEYLNEVMKVHNEFINLNNTLTKKNREIEKLNRQLQEVNDTDFLTKLPNRRKFFKDIYQITSYENCLLYMMDFNNFKKINDDLGHEVGNEALIIFSKTMSSHIEPYQGVLYRLGGDEFAILTPVKTDMIFDDVIIKVDKVIQKIHKKVSISYGMVEVDKEMLNATKPEHFMEKADQQMYIHKMKKKKGEIISR